MYFMSSSCASVSPPGHHLVIEHRLPDSTSRSGFLGAHLDGATGAFGGAQAAALAVVVVDLVLAVGELDDGVVGADAVAVVAAEAVAAGHAAARLVQRRAGVEPAGHLVEGADPPGRLEPGPHGVRRIGVIPGVQGTERG